jgi:hypothetical protein
MYIFSFLDVADDHVQSVIDQYTTWLVHEEVNDNDNVIELHFGFNDSMASMLHDAVCESEIFGGYWEVK